jgi:hypothetical protein
MAQMAAVLTHLPSRLLQMIMLPPDTRRGPVVCVLCRSLSIPFFLLCCPVTGDIPGDLFSPSCFASVLPLPLLMCILSYKYLLQGCVCCYPILF